jgi:hypothetical protein
MSLLSLIIALVVVGVLLWLINTYVPMDPKVKTILNIAVIVILVIWLLYAFGVMDDLRSVRVPRV